MSVRPRQLVGLSNSLRNEPPRHLAKAGLLGKSDRPHRRSSSSFLSSKFRCSTSAVPRLVIPRLHHPDIGVIICRIKSGKIGGVPEGGPNRHPWIVVKVGPLDLGVRTGLSQDLLYLGQTGQQKESRQEQDSGRA